MQIEVDVCLHRRPREFVGFYRARARNRDEAERNRDYRMARVKEKPGREPVIEMKRSGIEITAWRNEPGREPVTRMERGGTRIRAWRKATNI